MCDSGRVDESRLDFACQVEEGFLDVGIRLGRRLNVRNAELLGQLFALLGGDRSLLLPIRLVANQNLGDAFAGMLLDVGVPRSYVFKRLLVGNIEHEQDAHRTTVVGGGDGAETLLTRRVPDLQLDALAIQLNGADLEVNADGGDERGRPGIIAEAEQQA